MPRLAAFIFLVFAAATAAAQPVPLPEGPEAFVEPAPLVVMNLAAHPDDEDGQTLTYYRHAKNAIAYSVIYTRGEGGQNEIGPDLYEKLGAIRTQETERAARHLGTQVFFLNVEDFGFSKSAEETFARWGGRDSVTARLVYLVRKLKPDVLFTNHDTVTVGPRRQHGHHQVVGISAVAAMRLAADSTFMPEQLAEPGVDLWQPSRLFLRRWRFSDAEGEAAVAVPVGDADIATGAGYNQRASHALHEHASQGMGQFAARFLQDTTYFAPLVRAEGDAPLADVGLAANLAPNRAARYDVPYLMASGRLPHLGGLTVSDSLVVPGQTIRVQFDPEQMPARRLQIVATGAVDTLIYRSARARANHHFDLTIPADARPTLPKHVRQYDRYDSDPPLRVAVYEAAETPQFTPPRAAAYLPVEIAPALTLESPRRVVRLRGGENPVPLTVRVYDPVAEQIALNVAVTQVAEAGSDEGGDVLALVQTDIPRPDGGFPDAPFTHTLALTLPDDLPDGAYHIALTALATPTLAPGPYASLLDLPEPPGHGMDAAEPSAAGGLATLGLDARVFDAAVPEGLRVGLVESYDETLAKALGELGVPYVKLTEAHLAADLGQSPLDTLHTVLIDIRAYLVREDLRRHNHRLLEWVRGGGHLVVSYQKTFEWNADRPDPFAEGQTTAEVYPDGFAPYPITLGRDRVTREDAPVTLLVPHHPLMTTPNRIGTATWEGWVQERGLYFPETYDDRYVELFALSDPGEAPLRSSTLFAEVGDGSYLYTALGWYRQLGVFHPGAYAAFANLISYPLVVE